jgi:hypothetical protein
MGVEEWTTVASTMSAPAHYPAGRCAFFGLLSGQRRLPMTALAISRVTL